MLLIKNFASLQLNPTNNPTIKLCDVQGKQIKHFGKIGATLIFKNNLRREQDLIVVSKDTCFNADILLGMDFLQNNSASISWKGNTMSLYGNSIVSTYYAMKICKVILKER